MRLLRFRFSLLGLMALVAYVALACAALRYSTELWASSVFTLAVVVQMVAVVSIACRSEAARAGWAGFLIFGGGYLLLALGPWSQSIPPLITSHGLVWLDQKLHSEASQQVAITVSGSPYVTTYTNLSGSGTITANQVLLWDAATGRSLNGSPQTVFIRIGHSLLSPLLGLIGAMVAMWLYARAKQREQAGETVVAS